MEKVSWSSLTAIFFFTYALQEELRLSTLCHSNLGSSFSLQTGVATPLPYSCVPSPGRFDLPNPAFLLLKKMCYL